MRWRATPCFFIKANLRECRDCVGFDSTSVRSFEAAARPYEHFTLEHCMNQTVPQPAVVTSSLNSHASIVACLGQDAATYAANKHRGGSNGKKGARYEDAFLAYKVAEIAARRVGVFGNAWPLVAGQTQGFVDDVLVREATATNYFQLKNVKDITWTGGKHPITTDFSYQYRLACHENQPGPITTLVVADEALRDNLQAAMPAEIAPHSAVVFFPYSETLNRLVLENPALHDTLRKISRSSNPPMDDLVGVLGVLVMASGEFVQEVSVEEIFRAAHRYYPGQIRTVGITSPAVLRAQFVSIVDGIAGLQYDVSQGFFSWDGYGTSGIFDFDCSHPRFEEFQKLVEEQRPTTFERFEELAS
jgi:hypothetical protein